MADHVLTMTLAPLRGLPGVLEAQRERTWARREATSLRGATVAIVGSGAVGRAAAQRFNAFEARVVGIAREPRPLPGLGDV